MPQQTCQKQWSDLQPQHLVRPLHSNATSVHNGTSKGKKAHFT